MQRCMATRYFSPSPSERGAQSIQCRSETRNGHQRYFILHLTQVQGCKKVQCYIKETGVSHLTFQTRPYQHIRTPRIELITIFQIQNRSISIVILWAWDDDLIGRSVIFIQVIESSKTCSFLESSIILLQLTAKVTATASPTGGLRRVERRRPGHISELKGKFEVGIRGSCEDLFALRRMDGGSKSGTW